MNNEKIKIAKKTLKILSKKSWSAISLKEVFYGFKKKPNKIKTKNDLLKNINRFVDYLLKKETKLIEQSSKKDMLFEVIMARFDILQINRKSYINIYNSFKVKPHKSLLLIPSFLESMLLTARIANLNVKGVSGSIRLKGIFILYIATFFVWMVDETPSLEKTMTALDKYLDRAGNIINNIL